MKCECNVVVSTLELDGPDIWRALVIMTDDQN